MMPHTKLEDERGMREVKKVLAVLSDCFVMTQTRSRWDFPGEGEERRRGVRLP